MRTKLLRKLEALRETKLGGLRIALAEALINQNMQDVTNAQTELRAMEQRLQWTKETVLDNFTD